jgi:phosphatidylglycerol---prolipoprotein diacylglyceryl transferase
MTSFPPLIAHTLLEMAAYTVGAQVYFRERRRLALPTLADGDRNLWIIVAAALGAALGAKLAFWLEDPGVAFLRFPDWRQLLAGKSIVGGLAGHTDGNPTTLPWGVNFGDGIPRHPTQLYEIAFLAAWTTVLLMRRPRLSASGKVWPYVCCG